MIIRGHLVHISGAPQISGDPRDTAVRDCLVNEPDGVLVVDDDGHITFSGRYGDLPKNVMSSADTAPGDDRTQVRDIRPGFIMPGFVDTHIHFPQTYCQNSYGGGQLLEWLDRCIFPAEARYADDEFAARAAQQFNTRRIAAGTTAAMVCGSAFAGAQDALFLDSVHRGLRVVSGRGIQTSGDGPAAPLVTGEERAIELCRDEIKRWHGDGLAQVALVPRFSLSVTPTTLAALGDLYDDVRSDGVYFHTHLSENNRPVTGEIDITKKLYGVENYLDTYDGKFLPGSKKGGSSLLGRRSIMAHGVHCTTDELRRLAETHTSIAHCPTSQLFLGSGTMPWLATHDAGINVALGTDVSAGDEWLISRVANDCYKVHMSEPGHAAVSIDPAELLFAATLAGARALDQEDRFGNLDSGKDADFLIVDPSRWQPLAQILEHAERADDTELASDQILFALIMGLREPAITDVYVKGRRVS